MGISVSSEQKDKMLEYEKNEDIITKPESYKRIDIILIIWTAVFNFIFNFVILIIFTIDFFEIYNLHSPELGPIIPRIPAHILSVSNANEIMLNQFIVSKNNTLKIISAIDGESLISFSNFNYSFPYVYDGELYFLYGKINRESGQFKKASDLKFSTKYYKDQYLLQNEPSLVRVGYKIWLYGKFNLFSFKFTNLCSSRCWCN